MQMRTFGAERGVRPVAGIDPCVIVIHVEDPCLDITEQRRETLGVLLDVADTSRKQGVAGPEVSVPLRIVVDQRHRSRRVPAKVDDVQDDVTELERVAV